MDKSDYIGIGIIIASVIFIPLLMWVSGAPMPKERFNGTDRELLKLQIEEKQLKIKQLKSGACVNE